MKNKIMWKRLMACVLTVCMTAGLAGCGSEETNKSPAESSTSVKESSTQASESVPESSVEVVEEPAELTYWCALDANTQATLTSFNDMEYLTLAEELLNVDVTYSHPASGTETEQFNLKMSGLDLEDIMESSWGSYPGGPSQAIADGIIIDLAPYLEEGYAPNFKKILDENPHIKKQITTDKGEIWAFPAIGINAVEVTVGYIVRSDMLKKVGLDYPETIADWEEMLIAFRDELGVQAPFTGTSGQLASSNAWIAGAFDTYPGYYLRDGQVQYGYMDDNFKTYLETMNRWYEEKLIDQDFFGNDGKTVNSKILNDQAGVFLGFIGSGIGTLLNSAKETNPDMNLEGIALPVLSEGNINKFMNRSWDVKSGGQAAITTACEDIEAAMKYLDYWYSEEGKIAKNFGVEGVSYEMKDGQPYYTDEILNNPDGLSVAHALGKYTRASQSSVGLIDRRYYEQYYQLQQQVDAMNLWNADTTLALDVKLPSIAPSEDEAEELAAINASINTYAQEETTKFIMGLRDISEFDSFVDGLKALNVERALEIQQEAYERYQAK